MEIPPESDAAADELDDSNDAGERIHKFRRAHSMDTTQVDSTPKIKFFDKIDMWPDPNDHSRLSRMPNAHTLYSNVRLLAASNQSRLPLCTRVFMTH